VNEKRKIMSMIQVKTPIGKAIGGTVFGFFALVALFSSQTIAAVALGAVSLVWFSFAFKHQKYLQSRSDELAQRDGKRTPIEWNPPQPAQSGAARGRQPISGRGTETETAVDSSEILRAALAIHNDLAPLIKGLLEGLEATDTNREKASPQVEALFSKMVDASKGFEPGIATLTAASVVDRWLDRLIRQSDNDELSKLASAARQSLLALSKEVATALREEGWNKEKVTLHVSALSEKIRRVSKDYDSFIANLTVIISLDLYAKQLAEKLISASRSNCPVCGQHHPEGGCPAERALTASPKQTTPSGLEERTSSPEERLEEPASTSIPYTGDGKSQQTAIFFTGARTQLEHIGLQHQFIRDKGIAVVGIRYSVGEGAHLYDVWPTREGQVWFKVPPDPDPSKTRKEMEELLKKRQNSSAELGDKRGPFPADSK
jgi:hypothetical protein